MRILVLSCDKYYWLLPGFQHQWNKYCGLPITIVGFSQPDFKMQENFSFYSLGNFADYPADKWSDSIIKLLDAIDDKYIMIMLEDYWLVRNVDIQALKAIDKFCNCYSNIARFDLTEDRLKGGMSKDIGYIGRLDLIEAQRTSYNASLQASIWSTDYLKRILVPGESPWNFELQGTERLNNIEDMRVLGVRQYPVRYQIMVVNGAFSKGYENEYPYRHISESDLASLEKLGYTK